MLPFPPWFAVAAAAVFLGVWGFTTLEENRKGLDLFQSIVASFNLFGISLGQSGAVGVHPPWQLGVAIVLAASLTVRAVLELTGDRIRRSFIRHWLRGHVIVCGAGAIGSELADRLDRDHEVVVVDVDPAAIGLAAAPGRYAWPLRGDATLPETLLTAGISRAVEVFAVTTDDHVNARIMTSAQQLHERGHTSPRLRVHVRIDDPGLVRFFEERTAETERADEAKEDETVKHPAAGRAKDEGSQPDPLRASPFSVNDVAARALLGNAPPGNEQRSGDRRRDRVRVPLAMKDGAPPHLLLAGDHALLDAVLLEALRRWRAASLGGGERSRPPLRVSLYGPGAVDRAERIRKRWAPEPQLLELYSQDLAPSGEGAEDAEDGLLSLRGRRARAGQPGDYVSHAIVACEEDLAGITLALGVSRALGDGVPLTRIALEGKSTLDERIEERTKASRTRSTTTVVSLAELVCGDDAIRAHSSAAERLVDECVNLWCAPGCGVETREDLTSRAGSSVERLFDRASLDIHTDANWHFSKLEAPIIEALLEAEDEDPIPLRALVAAGLAINLHTAANLLAAAERLITTPQTEYWAFAACCEFARLTVEPYALAQARSQLAKHASTHNNAGSSGAWSALRVLDLREAVLRQSGAAEAQRRYQQTEDETAMLELEQRKVEFERSREALNAASAPRGAILQLLKDQHPVAIFAGGRESITAALSQRISELLGPRHVLLEAAGDRAVPATSLDGDAPATASPSEPSADVTRLPRPKRPQALEGFDGVVVCSGNPDGIAGAVARAAAGYGVTSIGYLPTEDGDASRFTEIRRTRAAGFHISQPIAIWTDLLTAGVAPEAISVVAFAGDQLTHAEILLARALGAQVGWVDTLRNAPLTLDELLPGGNEDILELPADAMSIRALICQTKLADPPLREHIAKQSHAEYRNNQQAKKLANDPALAPWDDLLPLFKDSNRDQADDIPNKLAMIGYRLELKAKGAVELSLDPEQVEKLAEMEHGRYNVERLRRGWKQGDRDVNRRRSPYFKPWDDLGDAQQYDREAVKKIPSALDSFGYGVTKLDKPAGRPTSPSGKAPSGITLANRP